MSHPEKFIEDNPRALDLSFRDSVWRLQEIKLRYEQLSAFFKMVLLV